MKAFLLAFLIAVSIGTWSYTKLQSKTGYGNAQTTIKIAGLVFVIAFVVAFTIGKFEIFH
jgi:hypothetical protein